MKIGEYEVKQRDRCWGKDTYCLFKGNQPVSILSFGSYEAAIKRFEPFMIKHSDSAKDANFLEISTNERTVGNYSNIGYLKLMGDEIINHNKK